MSNTHAKYKRCSKCVMDTSDTNIYFFSDGSCNHCSNYNLLNQISSKEKLDYEKTIQKIKKIKNKYNCLIGVSGGLDSTFMLIHAVQDLGLKPLALHVDNGWNTGLASQNISKLCDALDVDLYTEVLDWDEFRDMQLSILKAGTPDLEAPTDLFINYTLRNVAKKFKIKYIFSGANPQTEGVMGSNWSYGQRDPLYLKGLFLKFRKKYPKFLPFRNWYLSLLEQIFMDIVIVRPLRYIKYGKNIAVSRSISVCNWTEYPRKHGESFITRFYQNYFLPTRFGFDKRNAHYSALILNGDMTRQDAIKKIKTDELTSLEIQSEIEFFVKKLQISRDEFNYYMSSPLKYHDDYSTIKNTLIFKVGARLKNFFGQNSLIYRKIKNLITN